MKAFIISDNRDMIIHVLQTETGARPICGYSPDFTCTIGNYELLRNGQIITTDSSDAILQKLAFLGLCDYSGGSPAVAEKMEETKLPNYTVAEREGHILMNLFSIISARQFQLNQALSARDAFRVSPALMHRFLAHPPETVSEVLWLLYDHESDYRGICISRLSKSSLCTVTFTGFQKCPPGDAPIYRQLAERIMQAARDLLWIKPFTKNARNRKYAFHTWLYQIGMAGPEYETARSTLLGRLYGKAGQRRIDNKGGKQNG